MQTWIDLRFADGEYSFRLGLAQISEIERRCDAGIGAIFARTSKGRYGFADGEIVPEAAEYRFGELVEVIRQALIGGNAGIVDGNEVKVSSLRAGELIDRYVLAVTDQRMILTEVWKLAYSILHALMHGYTPPPKA